MANENKIEHYYYYKNKLGDYRLRCESRRTEDGHAWDEVFWTIWNINNIQVTLLTISIRDYGDLQGFEVEIDEELYEYIDRDSLFKSCKLVDIGYSEAYLKTIHITLDKWEKLVKDLGDKFLELVYWKTKGDKQ